jgi:hypothetical protein
VEEKKELLEIENALGFRAKRAIQFLDFVGLKINENVFAFEKKLDMAEFVHEVGRLGREIGRGH